MKVIVAADIIAAFRRRALRRYPREYMETIFGRATGGAVHIFAFHPIPHDATRAACYYAPQEIESQREDAEEHKLELLGTIHSHPDGGSSPSEEDWETAGSDGEIVSGICQILKRKNRLRCRIRFYAGEMTEIQVRRKGK